MVTVAPLSVSAYLRYCRRHVELDAGENREHMPAGAENDDVQVITPEPAKADIAH